jgi:hypothetical protein
MKNQLKLAASVALLFSFNAARADLVMEQETSSITGKSHTTMSIKGNMVRTDVDKESSVIIDTASGDMTTLMHEGKMMMKMNTKALAAAAAATAPTPGTKVEPAKLVKTGKSEKVGGYDCDLYTMESTGVTTKMWIAKKYPGYDSLKKQLGTLAKMASNGAEAPEMPGMAIKTETVASGVTFTTMLLSLKEQKVDDAVFKVPAGYKALGQ